jgi:hypothetical protein
MARAALALFALAWGSLALCAEAACAAHTPEPVDRNGHDSLFLGVPFGIGNTEVMHLSNTEKKEQSVRIETYSTSGCVLQEVEKTVPGSGSTDVRVELAQLKPGYGWLRVISKTKGVTVTSAQEVLRGNTLSTVNGRHPTSRGPEGRLSKLNHRWTTNLTKDASVLEYFVNLSEHPVQVGICEADRPNFFCRTLSHTVAPMAQVAFRIDRSHRYLVVESTSGYSAAMGISFVDGNKQVFDSSSSIKFDDNTADK